MSERMFIHLVVFFYMCPLRFQVLQSSLVCQRRGEFWKRGHRGRLQARSDPWPGWTHKRRVLKILLKSQCLIDNLNYYAISQYVNLYCCRIFPKRIQYEWRTCFFFLFVLSPVSLAASADRCSDVTSLFQSKAQGGVMYSRNICSGETPDSPLDLSSH